MSWLSSVYHTIAGIGENLMGKKSTKQLEKQRSREAAAAAAAASAAHSAEVASLAQDALGPIALRRRRGSYATSITGTPMMGTNVAPTGKTLLGQ